MSSDMLSKIIVDGLIYRIRSEIEKVESHDTIYQVIEKVLTPVIYELLHQHNNTDYMHNATIIHQTKKMHNFIIHRYDNAKDILSVKDNECSDVYKKAKGSFDYILVIPTKSAKSDKVLFAKTTSDQYQPSISKSWPGRPDKYSFRVDIDKNTVNFTTLTIVKQEFIKQKINFEGPWTVRIANLNILPFLSDN